MHESGELHHRPASKEGGHQKSANRELQEAILGAFISKAEDTKKKRAK